MSLDPWYKALNKAFQKVFYFFLCCMHKHPISKKIEAVPDKQGDPNFY
jgi:hypothetical protein